MSNLGLRPILFIAVVALIFIAAVSFLLARIYRRAHHQQAPTSHIYQFAERVLISAAALGLLFMLYARFIEPFWPKVIHVQVSSAKLAKGRHPIRVVQIADVHSDSRPRLEERIPQIVAAQHPDLLVFTGDSANSPRGIPVFRKLMTSLAGIAPTFAVRGNWDEAPGAHEQLFAATGVEDLDGEAVRRTFRGTPVWIGGLATTSRMSVREVFAAAQPDEFRIFLHHFPDRILGGYDSLDGAAGQVDLMCAAHTHGGQIALPIYGALVTFSRFDKRFEWGLYKVDGAWLYVNRGIGMDGGSPRMRFWARPEITVIDIVPAE